jgi:hypothetical protein
MTASEDPKAYIKGLHEAWFSQADVTNTPPHKLLRAVLMMTARGRPVWGELLDRAVSEDQDAEALVCWAAADHLMRAEPLPEPLAAFVSDLLLKKVLVSESARDYQNVARNIFAVHAIAQISARFGLHKTRGRNKHHSASEPSACTLVAEVLGEKEGTIQDVWEKKRRKFGIFD